MTVLFVSLISHDDRPLYIQSFDESLDRYRQSGLDLPQITHPYSTAEQGTHVFETSHSLSSADASKFLKYNFLSHLALDVLASPMSLNLHEQQVNQDGVLLLFMQDGVIVYGMETNNGLRMVAGISEEVAYKSQLKVLFSQIHKCYLRIIRNPFADISGAGDYEKILQNKDFDSRMNSIVNKWK